MERRVRLQDIAAHLGVHYSTVSRALRNDPALPAQTTRRVKAMAEKLGYEPDPNAKAMAVYRHSILPATLRSTLSVLVPETVPWSDLNPILGGLRPHAEKLGYQIELVSTEKPGKTGSRLTRILKTRGTAGLLVMPPAINARSLRRLQMDWSQFPAVVLGHSLFWPPLHRISNDHFSNAKQLVRHLTSLGYRRIGMCVQQQLAALHADGGWRGGYVVEMERFGECPRPFYRQTSAFNFAEIRKWVHRERLDAVIVDSDIEVQIFCQQSGFAVPKELGVAGFFIPSQKKEFTGIDPQFDRVWAAAVDFLVYLIRTNQRGIPEFPHRLLFEGTWVPGKTARRKNQMGPI